MLIVCPNCTTSYQIDPTAVGPTGRMVRCVRCKATWVAAGSKSAPEVTASVDNRIAEAEAQTAGGPPSDFAANSTSHPADDFDTKPPSPEPELTVRIEHFEVVQTEPIAPESVAITNAPSLVPSIDHEALPAADHTEHESEDLETFAARRQRLKMRRQQARRSSHWTAIVLVLFALNVALVGARNEVVRFLPQTASLFAAIGLPVNLRNLKFDNVRISKEVQDGVSLLIIEGNIVSTASKPIEVPRLRFAARNAGGQEVYTWTAQPSRSSIQPGERLEFSSQMASPPADANDIMVRFFNSQDAVAGTK